jgi:hypothetical protein
MTTHTFLALAALALLGVVAVQNYWVPLLRQKTISSGLTGPYDGLLLAAFALLSAALVLAFRHQGAGEYIADAAAGFLVLTGVSGRFSDDLPDGELWHTRFTAVTFVLAITLQFVMNGHNAALWVITGGAILYALTTHFLVSNASVTEKVGVTGLCLWLAAWGLTQHQA